ncbi:hypothetical protein K488DRAFT_91138 [Vararia minispora EC-137]|uniref:Uncharacterized protein n=1 Tax=Vararia minispora EC-137 TaxID=1314806 RepID=A0ACB8Q635_9AGAM|nr:hypothetical protein K488DRAFT_91138 [Vararia minispora EC-137]
MSSPDSSPDPFNSGHMDSSPILEPLDLSGYIMDEDDVRPMDPYAGSRHGRPQRMYEKKPPAVGASVLSTPPSSPPVKHASLKMEETFEELFAEEERVTQMFPPVLEEETVWRDAISSAVDAGEQMVDLSGRGLTSIPEDVRDMAGIIAFPNSSLKAHGVNPARPFTRSHSGLLMGTTGGVGLNLAQNTIRTLPPNLFVLQNLTFLSLRNNQLDFIPPQISELRSLQHLNVALNWLPFLPAEILTLPKLEQLLVHPNKFLPDPSSHIPPDHPRPCHPWRAVGATNIRAPIPSLTEITLRSLMSPSVPDSPKPLFVSRPSHNSPTRQRDLTRNATLTNIHTHYALPLTQAHGLPERCFRMLARAAPGIISRPLSRAPTRDSDVFSRTSSFARTASTTTWTSDHTLVDESEPGLSRCPGLQHLRVPDGAVDSSPEGDWTQRGPPYFEHGEERLIWVDTVRGIRIGEVSGGVPLLWRGCERGCLDFLGAAWPSANQQDEQGEDIKMA